MEDNKVYQLFEDMKNAIEETQVDVNKFSEKGNNSAGTRVRKAMQAVKNLGQEIRKEISEQKNA
tara:strand:+ start:62 stop:253 length:192 start_codon:yes stop_codon:yes gene_type:complete